MQNLNYNSQYKYCRILYKYQQKHPHFFPRSLNADSLKDNLDIFMKLHLNFILNNIKDLCQPIKVKANKYSQLHRILYFQNKQYSLCMQMSKACSHNRDVHKNYHCILYINSGSLYLKLLLLQINSNIDNLHEFMYMYHDKYFMCLTNILIYNAYTIMFHLIRETRFHSDFPNYQRQYKVDSLIYLIIENSLQNKMHILNQSQHQS